MQREQTTSYQKHEHEANTDSLSGKKIDGYHSTTVSVKFKPARQEKKKRAQIKIGTMLKEHAPLICFKEGR